MKADKRKVVLVGTGLVGMSFAYALLNQNACEELVLIDLDRQRAEGLGVEEFKIVCPKCSLVFAEGVLD